MDNFEKVEKLREKANVSFEEAKAALEESNWDLLDAMIVLEKQGKTEARKEKFSTKEDADLMVVDQPEKKEKKRWQDSEKSPLGKSRDSAGYAKVRPLFPR